MPTRTIALALAAAALLWHAPRAMAAEGGRQPDEAAHRIGLVDFSRALNEVSDGRKAKERLKNEFQEKQQRIDRLQSEVKSLKGRIDRDRLLLSEEAIRDREEEYRRRFSELEQAIERFNAEISAKESQLTQEILSRLKEIVKEMGREGGYSLILEKSQDVVLYAPEAYDLTDRVIVEYDRLRGVRKR